MPESLWQTIRRAELASGPSAKWNLIKLHTNECALTFLNYPGFDTDPHPALAQATKINLKTGSVTQTDYSKRANPPILHRKESFLPPGDPRIPPFTVLTRAEEEAGLYRDPSTIGFQVQWTTLLRRLGYSYSGHNLIRLERTIRDTAESEMASIARHRTAIKRYDLSRPVKQILERGLLRKSDAFFDFGCGHGMDIEALKSLGYDAQGWDPAFRPNACKVASDVVNLGFVLNVIEEPTERVEALREAFSLAKRFVTVSVMATGQESEAHSRPYRDGFITKANTFQKFYAPGELEELIECALNVEAITLGLGICVAFQNAAEAEAFQAQRNRRRIDWTNIGTQLRFTSAPEREQRQVDRYQLHAELFDSFWRSLIELGRVPEPGEFDRLADVADAAGNLKRAVALVVEHHGETAWQAARKARTDDVLVYFALTNFRKRFLRRDIPPRIKHDVKAFFVDQPTTERRAKELLFAAGDPGEIELACEKLGIGWQEDESLVIHRSLLSSLPAVLRIFVHCAAYRYGDPEQADLIKIHKRSGKITFQHYDDFDGRALPRLQLRIKVNLRNLFVEVFDHSIGPKTQLLFFKERFVGPDYPNRAAMERFSVKVRALGLAETTIGFGPTESEFEALARSAGLSPGLTRLRSKPATATHGSVDASTAPQEQSPI